MDWAAMTPDAIRVIIADDHPSIRAGVRALLDMAGDIDVVASVGTSEDVVRAARELQPAVVIMDLRMPTLGGVEATRAIVHQSPEIAVLVLTMVHDDDSIFAALQAGARGYLLKESDAAELHRAVHAVANGELITSPTIARRLSELFVGANAGRAHDAFPSLSHRELEVLELIARGENNPAIARTLFLSPKTVRNHISNIFTKVNFADRSDAIVRAREAGLGTRD
jgi:DNA-binding NarL/FixJ family response regulator